ncbi:nuclear transport factor 2 family protein [Saccharopolyspora phatthalungensis]|uniref:Bifunctional aromatase (Cyclase/dehydratase) n=1 Tax=Saccharopolyspora phatthalungensis TaxID=664693 RepID=A0A840QAK0_9PSEU|nr:nuclear transport factor 2 family protein [Saccharopolyspora phatthalungensis]MBB5156850.1 bifunctional aromatase (cyclase/dehydratase) [Saccharopolyspora phatthalungensis]
MPEESSPRHVVRAELEQFYAEQMAMLDEGDATSWVDTFTEDGSFVPPNGAPEVKGRTALREGTDQTITRLSDAGTVRRHVLTNLNLVALEYGQAQTVAYVLVVDSTKGESQITTSTVMRDELTSDGTRWRVARRVVRRDDLAAADQIEP